MLEGGQQYAKMYTDIYIYIYIYIYIINYDQDNLSECLGFQVKYLLRAEKKKGNIKKNKNFNEREKLILSSWGRENFRA
jgi:hypothetical protein